MYFYNLIKKLSLDKEIVIFVDMDGVVSSYDLEEKINFLKGRPLITNINILKKVNDLENVRLYILSVCIKKSDILDKNTWLDKYVPFISKEKRIILDKESNGNISSKELKLNYLKSIKTNKTIVLIDDDNEVLKYIHNNLKDIILYQDSVLID